MKKFNNRRRKKKYVSFYNRQRIAINSKINSILFIKQSINNLFFTAKDRHKRVLVVRSCGFIGFKGSKRGTFFAAVALAKEVSKILRLIKKKYVRVVLLSKITKNTKLAIKNLSYSGIRVLEIIERIPVSHNGLRGSKIRRL